MLESHLLNSCKNVMEIKFSEGVKFLHSVGIDLSVCSRYFKSLLYFRIFLLAYNNQKSQCKVFSLTHKSLENGHPSYL